MIQTHGGDRLRVTLLDRMSAVENGRSSFTGLTLDAVLRADKRGPPPPSPQLMPSSPERNHSSRTLLDVMRDEHRRGQSRDKTTWKSFRDKLRLKRTAAAEAAAGSSAAAWTSNPIPSSDNSLPASDIGIQDNESHRSNQLGFLLSNSLDAAAQTESAHHLNGADAGDRSAEPTVESLRSGGPTEESVGREGRMRLGVALAEERALSAREAEAAAATAPPQPPPQLEMQPPRMSLMDLLEETDQPMALSGAIFSLDNEEEEEEEEEAAAVAAVAAMAEERDGGGGGAGGGARPLAEESSCCVCMIRSKGAAFIPCGHTFCRLCSRELWVQRGNCPLCNAYILEILDIF